ncbi:potassium-transporting ATPase subunit F [Paenibacillus sophorae]|uniref:Potassium-transporting ATPase subunit F n=1 Tax=Paenibacillus sophorae TaxID=1333845 RepID=A0ABX8HEH4_9BACL|nr:potassium-transporting ATPase subunit F [Paenibacillus sophorae]QWU15382.1 potassium-transporting ATPase subunit F [Paenibacillus sophorae]
MATVVIIAGLAAAAMFVYLLYVLFWGDGK